MNTTNVLLAIVFSALVTVIPRLLPFLLVKKIDLPQLVLRFLAYLPLSIIFALGFSSLFEVQIGQFPHLLWPEFGISLLTLWVAFRYKNLLLTVGLGVLAMAVMRLIL